VKINYRPEIDGLRAIAVFSVIIYHARDSFLPGGFLGVDIFFVISGYLITSLILKELQLTNKFSFSHFYERRIRRIIPALLVVMILSTCISYTTLYLSSFVDFSKSLISSIFSVSNFYFHYEDSLYSAESSLFKPLLHTWSLSLEEQFYILFPLTIFIIYKFFRKYLLILIISGILLSLILSQYVSVTHPVFNFYLLPTRGFELLLGSFLAKLELDNGRGGEKNSFLGLNKISPIIGLLLIFYSLLFFNDKMLLPSFYSLVPIFGTMLIIWFSHKGEYVSQILSNRIFVFFGLISYSLYLFHFPIFAFFRYLELLDSNLYSIILFIILISSLSYYFIEKTFRNKKLISFRKVCIILIIIIICLISFNSYVIYKDGFNKRYNLPNTFKLSNFHEIENKDFSMNYNYDNYDSRKNVLIVGNSHGEDMLRILSLTSLSNEIYFNLASPKIRKDDYNFQVNYLLIFLQKNRAIIDRYNGDFLNHLEKQYNNADLIILSTKYFPIDLNILDELLQNLKRDNKKVILFDNALQISTKAGSNLNRLDNFVYENKRLPNSSELTKIEKEIFEDLNSTRDVNLKLKEIANNNNVYLIERKKIFCDLIKKKCPAFIGGKYKIYYDYGHITSKGAEFFARKIEKNKLFLEYLNSTLNMSFK